MRPAALQQPVARRYLAVMDNALPDHDMFPAAGDVPPAGFSVSDRAAARIAEIVAAQPNASGPDWQALRVAVLAGGCSGFQYSFKLDGDTQSDDVEIRAGEARVLIDPTSLDLLAGAQLDYSEALMGAHFTVRNPVATSSCGCGTSFSID
jgi:iron-sulfur cluster insertion protein